MIPARRDTLPVSRILQIRWDLEAVPAVSVLVSLIGLTYCAHRADWTCQKQFIHQNQGNLACDLTQITGKSLTEKWKGNNSRAGSRFGNQHLGEQPLSHCVQG